jgi:hypothetical protein
MLTIPQRYKPHFTKQKLYGILSKPEQAMRLPLKRMVPGRNTAANAETRFTFAGQYTVLRVCFFMEGFAYEQAASTKF